MEKIDTNPSKYVVFDVETNGLKSQQDDLLSISFYKPDDKREYSRFLPLELNSKVETTHINGITEKDLAGTTALTQFEFDQIVEEYELEKRIILVYSGRNFDEAFLREYMKRHQISGFEKLKFYNIKYSILEPISGRIYTFFHIMVFFLNCGDCPILIKFEWNDSFSIRN